MWYESGSLAEAYYDAIDSVFWHEGKGEAYDYDYKLATIILNFNEKMIYECEAPKGVAPTRLYQCRDGSILTVTADRLILN